MGQIPTTLAYVIDWGWLRIGPYIHINMDPALAHIGPLKLTWYGLAYVLGITMGLWFIRRYTARKGINQDQVYRVLWWCVIGGVIGGRLYYVIQQPDFVQGFLLQPWRILATWEGGMAFFGAIFAVVPILFWRARRMRLNPLVMLDAGALFAACGQIFGRLGNLVNGDIIGYHSTLPWSTVYENPNSWACLTPVNCNTPVQPAAGYELLLNIVMLVVLVLLSRRYRKPGALMATYLFGYTITQFLIFFARANIVVPLGPLDWGLKQAQWTSLIVFILLIPITIFFMRTPYARVVPAGKVPATYGIPQLPDEKLADGETEADEEDDTRAVSQEPSVLAETSQPEDPPASPQPQVAADEDDARVAIDDQAPAEVESVDHK
ncbi:MAG TPA: prolipoprotein diacylglyceryl transferase [Ktedonobacteraceae bacterium]